MTPPPKASRSLPTGIVTELVTIPEELTPKVSKKRKEHPLPIVPLLKLSPQQKKELKLNKLIDRKKDDSILIKN